MIITDTDDRNQRYIEWRYAQLPIKDKWCQHSLLDVGFGCPFFLYAMRIPSVRKDYAASGIRIADTNSPEIKKKISRINVRF